MTLLGFGANGQVGTALGRLSDITMLSRDDVDLLDAQACAEAILDRKPTAVINAAAYTAVDQAQTDQQAAKAINSEAPGAMATACAALGIPFVHISTDYVFPGIGSVSQSTSDPTGPLGVYGQTKLDGENAVRAANGNYVILRTSWVFSETGNNFLKTMLRLGKERDALSIVADQVGGPTFAEDIARACLKIAFDLAQDPSRSGIYHFSGAPDCSWADFASEIFKRAGLEVDVTPIPTSAYPTPALRPLNSRLDCRATSEVFGIERPNWRDGIDAVLERLSEEKT